MSIVSWLFSVKLAWAGKVKGLKVASVLANPNKAATKNGDWCVIQDQPFGDLVFSAD